MNAAPVSTLRDQVLGRVVPIAPVPSTPRFEPDRVRIALFDFDGTLVNTMGAFADLAAATLSRTHGVDPVHAREAYLVTSGIPFDQQCETIFPRDPRNRVAVEAFEQGKLTGFFSESYDADVPPTLRFLRSSRVRVGVSSNNFQNLLDRFVTTRPEVHFDVVLGAREGFFKGRDHFAHVERVFGVRRSEILFVGDSLKDAEKALECGVMFVGRCGTFEASDFLSVDDSIPTIGAIGELKQLFVRR